MTRKQPEVHMKLLIEIGNSSLKCAQLQGEELITSPPIYYAADDLIAQLNKHWRNIKKPSVILLASVAAENITETIEQWCLKRWKLPLTHLQSCAEQANVTNAYASPARLGIDRWLGIIASYHAYHDNTIIISSGTALTIDAVDKHGKHLGGLIIPGLRLMRHALVTATHGIRPTDQPPAEVSILACDTEGGVMGGTLYATVATIDRIVNDLIQVFDSQPQLVITGGDAASLLPLLAHRYNHHQDLVFEGMAILAREAS